MSEQELKEKMHEGYEKVQPIVVQITNLVMDAYQEGFKNCWEILTGQKMEESNEREE